MANGIAAAGSGVGTVAVGPFLAKLMSALGWKHSARIFSALLLIPTLAALVYRVPASYANQYKGSGEKGHEQPKPKILDLSVFKNRAFIVLCFAMSVFMMGYFVPFVHVVSFLLVLLVLIFPRASLPPQCMYFRERDMCSVHVHIHYTFIILLNNS